MSQVNNDYSPDKLLWVDLEMTGLEPSEHRIIELAAIVTDFGFQELASLETVINQPMEVMDRANQWARDQHQRTGLWQASLDSKVSESDADTQLNKFIVQHFDPDQPVVLAGNSIHQDRRFIRTSWPKTESRLHYRMLDVSSYKIIMQAKYSLFYTKKETHRALDDIRESIGELKYYLDNFKR